MQFSPLRICRIAVAAPLFLLMSTFHSTAAAQQIAGPYLLDSAQHAVSPPLRLMKLARTDAPKDFAEEETQTPEEGRHPHADDATRVGAPFDVVLQLSAAPPLSVTKGLNFDGIPSGGFATSDVNGSVGATQFVQYTNNRFAIYDKSTGKQLVAPTLEANLWTSLGGPCARSNDGDIIVLYDKKAGRWIFTHHATPSGGPFYQCFAVSKSSDATGAYNLYAFQLTNLFPDYPKLGVWSDGYYLSANLEDPTRGFAFVASQVCALNRTQMLSGTAAQEVCFQTSAFDSLLPADLDGTTSPPTDAPELFLNLAAANLDLFRFKVNWTTLSKSTFTGPTKIPVAAYSEACGGLDCIPQLDTAQVLDSLGDRLMYRLAYRNYGTHSALAVTHSVVAGSSVGLRWYEIRAPFSTPVVYQQGTYAPDGFYRWMASPAIDGLGNIGIGYSFGGTPNFAGQRFAGRRAKDPLGQLTLKETVLVEGEGAQSTMRWEDYTQTAVDPSDDCTIWYVGDYMKKGAASYSSRIGAFRMPGCK